MNSVKKVLQSKTIYGLVIVLILWYILHFIVRSMIIPAPHDAISTFFRLLQGSLPLHMGASFFRILVAILLSLLIGIPLGLWMGLNNRAEAILSPISYILYPIPKIAFLPVFMILFGLGNSSKIILIVAIIFFQILLAARDGVKEIPKEWFYSVKSLGLSQSQIYMHLVVPAVLPKIMSALRLSLGVSIATLFFGENFATTYGIGYFIMNCWVMVDYIEMFAGILALSLMGILMFKGIDLLERKLCPWLFL